MIKMKEVEKSYEIRYCWLAKCRQAPCLMRLQMQERSLQTIRFVPLLNVGVVAVLTKD